MVIWESTITFKQECSTNPSLITYEPAERADFKVAFETPLTSTFIPWVRTIADARDSTAFLPMDEEMAQLCHHAAGD